MNGKFTGGTRDPGKSTRGADIAGEPIGGTINHWEGPSIRLKNMRLSLQRRQSGCADVTTALLPILAAYL
jgi:hypothetical protein